VTDIVKLIGRLFTILGGYIAAALAASATLHALLLPALGFTPEEVGFILAGGAVVSIPFVAILVAWFAFLPFLAVVLVAEFLSAGSWLYYALTGGLTGLVVDGFAWRSADPVATLATEPRFIAVLVAAGIVGGSAYWLVAGRPAIANGRSGS
jgi:hypothetical protein